MLRETPDAVAITSPAGEIVYWNSGAEGLFGFSAAEAIGSSMDALIVPQGHVKNLDQFRREALATGVSTFETARLRKDGSLIYTVVSNKAIYDAEGRAELVVITQKFSMAEALEAGCDAYLHKPVSTRTLPETLRKVVQNAESDGDP